MMKHIAFIHLGGTISALGKNRLDLKDYQSGKLSGEDFLRDLPELKELAHIEMYQMERISSTQINENHWIQLKQTVDSLLNEKKYDGVVITHGTSTLEETAYFLHLTVNSNKPVVLVGAQRPFSALSSDAPLQLIQAVRVAIDKKSIDMGVLIIGNDRIHSARDVTKTETYRLDTFKSGDLGCLGYIETDQTIQYYRKPVRKHTMDSVFSKMTYHDLPSVEIVYSYAVATGKLIDFMTQSGEYQGVVIAGTGAGRFSKLEESAISKATQEGLYVVRSSRGGNGRVVGIEAYRNLRTLSGDNLTPQKARILLMLSILKYTSLEAIQQSFEEY